MTRQVTFELDLQRNLTKRGMFSLVLGSINWNLSVHLESVIDDPILEIGQVISDMICEDLDLLDWM